LLDLNFAAGQKAFHGTNVATALFAINATTDA
jgi:hypothetical protein